MDLPGVGPVVAARVLADVGDVARFTDRNRFASWTGTAPIDASSGETVRHRLSRAGNRRMNHMIHMAAATQLRHDTEGRAYYRRKLAAGKTKAEAMRCLKRGSPTPSTDSSVADAKEPAARRGRGPGRALRGVTQSSAAGSHPHTGTSDQPLPGPAPTTLRRHHHDTEEHDARDRSNQPLDTRGAGRGQSAEDATMGCARLALSRATIPWRNYS